MKKHDLFIKQEVTSVNYEISKLEKLIKKLKWFVIALTLLMMVYIIWLNGQK